MFSLAMRSMVVLSFLFGLAFAVAMAAMHYIGAPWFFAVGIALAMLGLQCAIGPTIIQWIHKIEWCDPASVDPALGIFLAEICREKNLKPPRFGIIHDGNPNAFTFGHYPGNARVVVTTGLLEICDEQEAHAVVAHEIGHIIHWDFVVMTLAAAVPMILYFIYRFTLYSGRGRSRNQGAALVGIGALIAYLISRYVVIFLSRVREYYADHFAADYTRNPNGLASALVKIAYGLASQSKEQIDEKGKKKPIFAAAGGMGTKALGVFDGDFGASMALAAAGSYTAEGGYSADSTVKAMRWDLWNPWAFICELSSTHPLPAKRIKALENIAWDLGQQPVYDLPEPDERPESYWDEFAVDLAISYMPGIGLLLGLGVGAGLGLAMGFSAVMIGTAIVGLGLGMLIRVRFSHPSRDFPEAEVADLVSEIKVSKIRSIPCTMRGKIIGKGIPGLYWSEDLVVQDDTGFIRLDYRQPLRFLEFLFGAFKADQFVGQDVEVTGWYRRWPAPFVELWKMQDPSGSVQTCYNYSLALIGSVVVTLIGIGVTLVGLLIQF